MAASSLIRLCFVVLILIALALSSGIAWGSISSDETDSPHVTIQSIEPPSWLRDRAQD